MPPFDSMKRYVMVKDQVVGNRKCSAIFNGHSNRPPLPLSSQAGCCRRDLRILDNIPLIVPRNEVLPMLS